MTLDEIRICSPIPPQLPQRSSCDVVMRFGSAMQRMVNGEPLSLCIYPGTASAVEIAALLVGLSDLYRAMGGSGIEWVARPGTQIVDGRPRGES